MRLLFALLALFSFPLSAFSQNSYNYLQVYTNAGLNFTVDDPASLETSQTINNAFSIRVRSWSNACSVYARITTYNVPAGFYPTSSPLYLDWTSDTSPNAYNLSTGAVSMDTYDKILFSQPKMSTSVSYYQYNYNLVLNGLTYDYPPGNYNFTLLFTMTQP